MFYKFLSEVDEHRETRLKPMLALATWGLGLLQIFNGQKNLLVLRTAEGN